MLTIILHNDDTEPAFIEVLSEGEPPHIVVISENEAWTDSPSQFTTASESEQAELIASYRNDGFEDRNP
jgi:hypothetical protein